MDSFFFLFRPRSTRFYEKIIKALSGIRKQILDEDGNYAIEGIEEIR